MHTQALYTLVHSWASRKFAVGCAILFPVAVTMYVTVRGALARYHRVAPRYCRTAACMVSIATLAVADWRMQS